jgi:hypothetical protein
VSNSEKIQKVGLNVEKDCKQKMFCFKKKEMKNKVSEKSHVLAVDNICGSLKGVCASKFPGFVSMVTIQKVSNSEKIQKVGLNVEKDCKQKMFCFKKKK